MTTLTFTLFRVSFLGFNHEENVSASYKEKIESAWVSRKNEHKGRKAHSEEKDG